MSINSKVLSGTVKFSFGLFSCELWGRSNPEWKGMDNINTDLKAAQNLLCQYGITTYPTP